MVNRRPTVLCLNAAETSGADGIVVDAMVCADLECSARYVVTAVLVVGPDGAAVLERVSTDHLDRQIGAAMLGGRPLATKVGILKDRDQVERVADAIRSFEIRNVVVAPTYRVSGAALPGEAVFRSIREALYPLARVVVLRAADLPVAGIGAANDEAGLVRAARAIRCEGAPAALVIGAAWRDRVLDVLDDAGSVAVFDAPRLAGPHVVGLSAAHRAALAAHLAGGEDLPRAVDAAQRYIGARASRGR